MMTSFAKLPKIVETFALLVCLFIALGSVPLYAKEIINSGVTFNVADDLFAQSGDLIGLILDTESMDDDERQYWFDILPSMTESQIDRLEGILEVEKAALLELELKYQEEIKNLNLKHISEFIDFRFKTVQTGVHSEPYDNVKILVKSENLSFDFTMKRYADKREDELPLSPDQLAEFLNTKFSSSLNEIIYLEYVYELVENVNLYPHIFSDSFSDDLYNDYVDLGAKIAVSLDDKKLQRIIATISDDHKEILLLEKGQFSAIAKKYENLLAEDTVITNPAYATYAATNLTYLRANAECFEYCGQLLIALSEKIDENHDELISKIEKQLKSPEFNTNLYMTPIWLDVAIFFNSDIKLTGLVRHKDAILSIKAKDLQPSKASNEYKWYVPVRDDLFNNSTESSYNTAKSTYKSIVVQTKGLLSSKLVDYEGQLLEATVYHAYSEIKNNRKTEARALLTDATKIGISYNSRARDYKEHKLRDFLLLVLNGRSALKGPKTYGVTYIKDGNEITVPFRNKSAVVVGISDYDKLPTTSQPLESNLNDLQFAHIDARSFRKFLENSPVSGGDWNIDYFENTDATMNSVRGAISKALYDAGKNDLVYLFFSGHGRSADPYGNDVFLMTSDAGKTDLYTGIDLAWLKSAIQRSKAKHVVAFIDACRSGSATGEKGGSLLSQEALLSLYDSSEPTKVIFSSGTGEQVSYEDSQSKLGYFTKYLLKALDEGAAPDLNDDGMVGLYEAQQYVSENVRNDTNGLQLPQIPNVRDFGRSVHFPLAIRQ